VAPSAGTTEGAFRLQTLKEMQYQAVKSALAATDGKKMEAARLLDIEYRQFKRLLDKFQI